MGIRKIRDKSFKLKNFRLSLPACEKLAKAAKRLGVPEVRIMEELVTRYTDSLRVDFQVKRTVEEATGKPVYVAPVGDHE